MEISIGKCLSCGKAVQMWRCGEVAGGGTYHIVCLECNERDSRQAIQKPSLWAWVGWMVVTGFTIGMFFLVLIFGGH